MRRVLAGAALCLLPLAAVPSPAHADDGPGSGFDSVTLSCVASSASFVFGGQASSVPAEMDVPYAGTLIKLGQGQATSSVAWPGDAGANLGSTLVVANPNVPQQASTVKDPFFARAQSGKGDPTVTNTQLPGATMTAHATTTETAAEGSLDHTSAAATTIGAAASTSASRLIGAASAETSGTTTLRDVTIAGVVHIGAITSTARATTDGVRADASGTTTVSGVTVAGQAVTLDEKGLTVAGTSVPGTAALQAVEQALAQAQVTLTYAAPTKSVRNGLVEYATGSVIATTPMGVLALGGVQLRAAATTGDALVTVPGSVEVPSAAPVEGGTAAPAGAVLSSTGGTSTSSSPLVPAALEPLVRALVPLAVVTGYAPGWVLAGALLSLLAAVALAALSGRVLPAAAASCPLEKPL